MAEISTHPDDDDLQRVARGESTDKAVLDHLGVCEGCCKRVDALQDDDSELLRPGSTSGGEEDADDESVRIIGDYELLEKIGKGGQGAVYRARQVHINNKVALKLVKPGARRYALSELAITINLEHQHLVRINHVGEHANRLYFTMKLAENGSLDKQIKEYRLLNTPAMTAAEREAVEERKKKICRLMAKIARGVHYLHDHGFIHCDLKPGNILLDAQGEPLVTDLGLARGFRDAADQPAGNGPVTSEQANGDVAVTREGTVIGTLEYMSPEQAQGRTDLGRPVDIYSLGVILHELLTGRRPFEGTKAEILAQTVDMERPAPSPALYNPNLQAGSDLELICLECLKKKPEDRYTSASALADDLECCARGQAIRKRPQSLRGTHHASRCGGDKST